MIGSNVTISNTNHPLHYQLRPQDQMYSKEVVIEDYVWISSNVVISAGVHIGAGSVIGAGECRHQGYSGNDFGIWCTMPCHPQDHR